MGAMGCGGEKILQGISLLGVCGDDFVMYPVNVSVSTAGPSFPIKSSPALPLLAHMWP